MQTLEIVFNLLYETDLSFSFHQTMRLLCATMSAGDPRSYLGMYNAYSRWIDHIAINHSVHFVVAAGEGSLHLRVPYSAMGYNCVTVGDITSSGWVYNSDYNHGDTLADKPDISCFGEDVLFPSNLAVDSGTSYSTPMVTGVLAQLCDYKPSLLVLQDRVKATICAAIPYPTLMYVTDTDQYHKSGAGLISSTSSKNTIARGFSKESYFSASDIAGTYKSYTFTLSNDTIADMGKIQRNCKNPSDNMAACLPDERLLSVFSVEEPDAGKLQVRFCEGL